MSVESFVRLTCECGEPECPRESRVATMDELVSEGWGVWPNEPGGEPFVCHPRGDSDGLLGRAEAVRNLDASPVAKRVHCKQSHDGYSHVFVEHSEGFVTLSIISLSESTELIFMDGGERTLAKALIAASDKEMNTK